MSDTYTKSQIDKAWNQYQSTTLFKVLKDGKNIIRTKPPKNEAGVIRCRMDKASNIIQFPKFLEVFFDE
jgi:hypothetical protein